MITNKSVCVKKQGLSSVFKYFMLTGVAEIVGRSWNGNI